MFSRLFGTGQPIDMLVPTSPAHRFPQLPIVLCVGLKSHGLFPVLV